MCNYERVCYGCGHEGYRLIAHCHFARNDPFHQCFGVKSIKRTWNNPIENCPGCVQTGKPQQRTIIAAQYGNDN